MNVRTQQTEIRITEIFTTLASAVVTHERKIGFKFTYTRVEKWLESLEQNRNKIVFENCVFEFKITPVFKIHF